MSPQLQCCFDNPAAISEQVPVGVRSIIGGSFMRYVISSMFHKPFAGRLADCCGHG